VCRRAAGEKTRRAASGVSLVYAYRRITSVLLVATGLE
jgi:hypothetical protein